MQKEKFHGITVSFSEVEKRKWETVKASFEETLKNLKEIPNSAPITVIAAPINANFALTVCKKQKEVEFGVYNKEQKKLIYHIDDELFRQIRIRSLISLESRSENMRDMMLQKKNIRSPWIELQSIWEKELNKREERLYDTR